MKHTDEATTFGYSRDMEKWVTGYESREDAMLQGVEDMSVDNPLPFDIYTAECCQLPLRYDVTGEDLRAARTSDDAPAFLVRIFKLRNEKADIDGTLFETLLPDDGLRGAISAATNTEQASQAMMEWLEYRSWLPGSRAIEIDNVRKHGIAESAT